MTAKSKLTSIVSITCRKIPRTNFILKGSFWMHKDPYAYFLLRISDILRRLQSADTLLVGLLKTFKIAKIFLGISKGYALASRLLFRLVEKLVHTRKVLFFRFNELTRSGSFWVIYFRNIFYFLRSIEFLITGFQNSKYIYALAYIQLSYFLLDPIYPTPPLGQDMTQSNF